MVGPTCRGPSTPCPPTSIDAGVNCVKDQWSEVPAEPVPRSVDGVTRKRHCLDIYIYTHISVRVLSVCDIILYYIYICVCVFLNPFEPNKQTYIKLHKLGQNHGWDQDRPRTPPGALGLSCGRGSVAVAQACLLFPHAVDLLLVDGHGPWLYGGFHKWGYPQIDGLKWKIQLKWMIWGYHYIRKPLYVYIYNYIYINYKL